MEDPTEPLPVRSPDDNTLYIYSNVLGFDKPNWKPTWKPMRFNVDRLEMGLRGEDDNDGSVLFESFRLFGVFLCDGLMNN